jgi:hypothetical protein
MTNKLNIIYEEYDNYWIYDDIIFIKPTFNSEISSSNFPLLLDDNEQIINNKLTQLCFSDYETVIDSITEYNRDKNIFTDIVIYQNNHVRTKSKFNSFVDNLSINMTWISFGHSFNKSVDNLPINLTHLIFGNNFHQLVDNLPCSLTYLIFGNYYDQPLKNLPYSIVYLDVGYSFDNVIENLPNSLTHLMLGYYSGQLIKVLPNNISDIYVPLCRHEQYIIEINDKVIMHYI